MCKFCPSHDLANSGLIYPKPLRDILLSVTADQHTFDDGRISIC